MYICMYVYNEFSCVIGAIYRAPNSNITMFNEKLNDILSRVTHMSCYAIGDNNIDLKHGSHSKTQHSLNSMYSYSLIPMIHKPMRETNTTATLIDNNCTSYSVENLQLQGLLIADISDHHAIFHIQDKYIHCYEQFELLRLGNERWMNEYKDHIYIYI